MAKKSAKNPQRKTLSRAAEVKRKTKETDIRLVLRLDGSGQARILSPVGFLNHMLDNFARHGLFDLELQARGDVEIDDHHTVEDIGICLGEAFQKALGDKAGIRRYGWAILPFDEVLVTAAVDLSGRPAFVYQNRRGKGKIGGFDVELAREFFQGFVNACGLSLHLVLNHGENRHHIIEAMFKAFAKALCQAVSVDPRVKGIPSTKGQL